MKYLALLRGINVGGNNIIKKDELKACFEECGCTSVLTYIQSGNILFKSLEKDPAKICKQVQSSLKKRLNNEIAIVLFTEAEYRQLVEHLPQSWGNQDQKANALFLLAETPLKEIKMILPEVDNKNEKIVVTSRAIFWSVTKSKYAKSVYVTNLVKSPLYKKVTIRNSNTTRKLLELFAKI